MVCEDGVSVKFHAWIALIDADNLHRCRRVFERQFAADLQLIFIRQFPADQRLSATQAAAAHLRETVGASFTLRGNPLDFNTDGADYEMQFAPISQREIDLILGSTEIKACNAQQSDTGRVFERQFAADLQLIFIRQFPADQSSVAILLGNVPPLGQPY